MRLWNASVCVCGPAKLQYGPISCPVPVHIKGSHAHDTHCIAIFNRNNPISKEL